MRPRSWPFTFGSNICPERSHCKWTALNTGLNTLEMHQDPHWDVVWNISDHILLTVCTHMSVYIEGPLTQLTSSGRRQKQRCFSSLKTLLRYSQTPWTNCVILQVAECRETYQTLQVFGWGNSKWVKTSWKFGIRCKTFSCLISCKKLSVCRGTAAPACPLPCTLPDLTLFQLILSFTLL